MRTIKESCLEQVILIGEASLRRAIREFEAHYGPDPQPTARRSGKTFTQTRCKCEHVGVYDGGEEIPLNWNFCARPPPASAVYTLPMESAARW